MKLAGSQPAAQLQLQLQRALSAQRKELLGTPPPPEQPGRPFLAPRSPHDRRAGEPPWLRAGPRAAEKREALLNRPG
jgi:hypothetical protein